MMGLSTLFELCSTLLCVYDRVMTKRGNKMPENVGVWDLKKVRQGDHRVRGKGGEFLLTKMKFVVCTELLSVATVSVVPVLRSTTFPCGRVSVVQCHSPTKTTV